MNLNGDFEVTNLPCNLLPRIFNISVYNNLNDTIVSTVHIIVDVPEPPPVINSTAVDQETTAMNADIVYNIGNLFKDVYGRPLDYTVLMNNGAPLQTWITYDSTTKDMTFATGALNDHRIRVTAKTVDGKTKFQIFRVQITNTLPRVPTAFLGLTKYENQTMSYSHDLATVFSEDDPNQSMTFFIESKPSLMNANIVGSMLSLDWTPAHSDIGLHSIIIRASDSFEYTDTNLGINVTENYGPRVPATLSDIDVLEGIETTHTVEIFTDDEADSITYSMTFRNGTALDSTWITFDGTTREVTLTMSHAQENSTELKIIAEDPYNNPTETFINIMADFKPRDNSSVSLRTGEFV